MTIPRALIISQNYFFYRIITFSDAIPTVIPNDMSSKEIRQNWARLIQIIYEVDPWFVLNAKAL
jgi:hypothetical protein